VWPLPIPEEMRSKLDSQVADLANIGNRYGGALQAGAFLKEFVAEGLDWAHLDIAGPARNTDSAYGYTPKGGTGFGVRTLVALAEALSG
jgi:leucyl aminopeptidase